MIARLIDSSYEIISPTLSSSQQELLKYIAIVTMAICHFGVVFSPEEYIYYYIGRVSFPIFAFLMVYNYIHHTKSPINYISRIVLMGIVAQPIYADTVGEGSSLLNIMFTLGAGLFLIYMMDLVANSESKIKQYSIGYAIGGFFLFAGIFVDYIHLGLILIIAYWVWLRFPQANTLYGAIAATVLMLLPSGYEVIVAGLSFFGILMIVMSIDVRVPRLNKWLYYVFYPAHLIVIQLARIF